jgi:TetR/AcrR family transcriptional repressor of bet genes
MFAVMVSRGYEAATIRRIARAAGLTPGLIHYHFKNKLAILHSLLEHLETVYGRYLDFDLAYARGPAEKVATFIDHHLSSHRATENPDAVACWAIVSGEAFRQPGFSEAVENAFKRVAAKLTGILRAGVEAGVFHCPIPEAAAAALVAAIHGYLSVASSTLEVIPHVSAAPCVKLMAAGLLQSDSECLRGAVVPPRLKNEPRATEASPARPHSHPVSLADQMPDIAFATVETDGTRDSSEDAEPDSGEIYAWSLREAEAEEDGQVQSEEDQEHRARGS